MTFNRKCNYCGTEYYICRSCIRAGNAWKNVCCSKKCFMELMKEQQVVKPIIKENTMEKVIMRGELKNGKTTDIIGYDLELGRFDSASGKTYVYDDFKFFYVPSDEMKVLVDYVKTNTENQAKTITKKVTEKKKDTDKGSESVSKSTSDEANKDVTDDAVKPVQGIVEPVKGIVE